MMRSPFQFSISNDKGEECMCIELFALFDGLNDRLLMNLLCLLQSIRADTSDWHLVSERDNCNMYQHTMICKSEINSFLNE